MRAPHSGAGPKIARNLSATVVLAAIVRRWI
jgi:hypothetical protein